MISIFLTALTGTFKQLLRTLAVNGIVNTKFHNSLKIVKQMLTVFYSINRLRVYQSINGFNDFSYSLTDSSVDFRKPPFR